MSLATKTFEKFDKTATYPNTTIERNALAVFNLFPWLLLTKAHHMCHPRSEGLGELVHCLCEVPNMRKSTNHNLAMNESTTSTIYEMERIETADPSESFRPRRIKNDQKLSRLGKHLHLLGTSQFVTQFVWCLFQYSSKFQSVPIRSDSLQFAPISPRLSFQSSLRAASSKTTSRLYAA